LRGGGHELIGPLPRVLVIVPVIVPVIVSVVVPAAAVVVVVIVPVVVVVSASRPTLTDDLERRGAQRLNHRGR